jgi:class 3 adenylate cyclase
VGLFFLGFFVNRPQERTRLYFGLACVALGLRVIPANYSDIGQILAPDMGFPTRLRLEYFANNFTVFAGIGYFAHKVPRDMPRAVVRVLQAGSLAAMAAALLLPLSWAPVPMRAAYVLGASTLAIALFALARAARRGEPDVRITLVAVPLCLGVVLWDSLQAEQGMGLSLGVLPRSRAWMAFSEAVALFPTTLVAMILVEAVVLMRAFSRSYRTIETLSQDLMGSNRELRETHRAVVRFVPFDFLRLLGKRSIREVERGDCLEAEMGILFCDIRSFTSLAESTTPEGAFRFVNDFTACMEGPIHEHGGFINEYLGDCILALFPTGSDAAVRAGTGMLAALDVFNRARATAAEPVRIGIGVNTGPLMLGTIGGSDRLAHAVIGDAVNVASRIESLTRLYGAEFLISGTTRERLSDVSAWPLRLLDRVVPKGTSRPIEIWEVLAGRDARARVGPALLHRFEQARCAYEARDFDRAERLFRECLADDPDDLASELYVARCHQLAADGVTPDWRGETVLTEK